MMNNFFMLVFLLISFVLLFFYFWYSYILISSFFGIKVPYVKTFKNSREAVFTLLEKILKQEKGENLVLADLGAGTGSFDFEIAKKFKGLKVIGVEKDFLYYFLAKIKRFIFNVKNANFVRSNFNKFNLKDVDIVYTFLYPGNQGLESKIKKELKKGSYVISNMFPYENLKLIEKIQIKKRFVYLYQI